MEYEPMCVFNIILLRRIVNGMDEALGTTTDVDGSR